MTNFDQPKKSKTSYIEIPLYTMAKTLLAKQPKKKSFLAKGVSKSPSPDVNVDRKLSGSKRERGIEHDGVCTDDKWSKSKKKRMRLRFVTEKKRQAEDFKCSGEIIKGVSEKPVAMSHHDSRRLVDNETLLKSVPKQEVGLVSNKTGSSSSLQKSFQERLSGSRFRILNEELYTSTSSSAFKRFQDNPSLFDEYHEGFRHQVSQWPVNPISVLVERLKSSFENKTINSKKKRKQFVVADFGCGDAELAKQLLSIRDINGNTPFSVHSFDLVSKGPNAELITACDAATTPLTSGTVDIGVFCLSLMGTNFSDFIREGHRVLKPDGKLFIAEVRSRFERTNEKDKKEHKGASDGKDEFSFFVQVLDELGFDVNHIDRSSKMFLLLDLRKNGKKPRKDLIFTAKPCIYKRR
jgi:ribosomal RNA-processing protein 8